MNYHLDNLCEDCPPEGYPNDKTRCRPCPRRVYAAPVFQFVEVPDPPPVEPCPWDSWKPAREVA